MLTNVIAVERSALDELDRVNVVGYQGRKMFASRALVDRESGIESCTQASNERSGW